MDIKLVPLSSLVAFGIPRPSKWAKDPKVCSLVRSIERDGLLNPLTIKPYKNKFLVVDGQKRLKALLLLARSSRFHKPSYKVSCVLEEETNSLTKTLKRPLLISAPELIHLSINALDKGYSPISIAQRFCCDIKIIDNAYAIRDLHPKVLQSFYNFSINLEQAIAFATIPNPGAQWTLLQQLGPFVSDKGVIDAIQNGDTVIETPDNQTIILPSREKVSLKRAYQRSLSAQRGTEKTEFQVAA